MNIPEPEHHPDRFSIVSGGPFHAVLGRLSLLGVDRLPTLRASVAVAGLAWLLPALAAVAQWLIDDRYMAWTYFRDVTVGAHLVAIGVMIGIERYADGRLGLLIRHFREARLIAEADLPAFSEVLSIADRRSSSALAEASIIAVALVPPSIAASYVVATGGSSWEGTLVADEIVLSWAGQIYRLVSMPLFIFLVLRWFWRFLVWSALLWRVSRLPLQLTPLHPDRAAGLGFLAIYPGIFSGLVFALSSVVASAFLKELSLVQHSAQSVGMAMLVWLAMVLVCFVGPLLAFSVPLFRVRERALLDYGRLATQHHQAFDRKWLGEASSEEDLMGSSDPSSVSDLNASVEVVQTLRMIPVDRFALIQLVAAAGIPLLAVVVTQAQLLDAAKWIIGALV